MKLTQSENVGFSIDYFLFFLTDPSSSSGETKKSSPDNYRGGPTHMDTDGLEDIYWFYSDTARLRCVSPNYTEGTTFLPGLLIEESGL